MTNSLESIFLESISNGLLRKSVSERASKWALNYIVLGAPIPGPMSFKYHPWSREWMDCQQDWIGKKAAQMAMTHAAIVKAMFTNDILRQSVLYILPKLKPDAADFSKTKFDAILSESPHIRNLYSSTKNVGLKVAGSANFFLRGARSRSGLKSISVGTTIYDEYDEMPQANITLAEERQAGYRDEDTQTIKISTPTLPDFGIDKEFQFSTQEEYIFPCPSCSRLTGFDFDSSLVITAERLTDEAGIANSYLICPLCKNKIDHQAKTELYNNARWERTKQSGIRGFYINQLYSCVLSPAKLAKKKLRMLESNEPADEQEWHNSSGGKPHITEGSKITEEQVKALKSNYRNNTTIDKSKFRTIGIDVGKWFHVVIREWSFPNGYGLNINNLAEAKVLLITKETDINPIKRMMKDFQVFMAVIDGEPEESLSKEFCNDFYGHAYRWYPSVGQKGKDLYQNDDERYIKVNRSSWLEVSQGRFRKGTLQLPIDTPDEYVKHISNLVRKPERDKFGNPTSKFINTGPDHYAFCEHFNELAMVLSVSINENIDIKTLL